MGAKDNRATGAEAGGTETTGSGNSSTSTSQNRGRGRGRGGTAATVNNEQVSQLADVKNTPKAVTIDVPSTDNKDEKPIPKTRGRPKGSTNKPTTRKTTTTAKTKIDAAQISVLLQTMTAIIAARPNMNAFAMTKDEADQLAKPLVHIIGKSDAIAEAAGEYADHITLLVAAITIFVPKFLLYKMQRDAAIAQIPKIQEVRNETTTTANNKAGEVSGGSNNASGQNRHTASIQNNGSTNTGSTLAYLGSPI